jgi:hypothetical protein
LVSAVEKAAEINRLKRRRHAEATRRRDASKQS